MRAVTCMVLSCLAVAGCTHHNLYLRHSRLALEALEKDRPSEALEQARLALENARLAYGPNDDRTTEARLLLAWATEHAGKPEEARRQYERLCGSEKAEQSLATRQRVRCLWLLSLNLEKTGVLGDAAGFFRRLVAVLSEAKCKRVQRKEAVPSAVGSTLASPDIFPLDTLAALDRAVHEKTWSTVRRMRHVRYVPGSIFRARVWRASAACRFGVQRREAEFHLARVLLELGQHVDAVGLLSRLRRCCAWRMPPERTSALDRLLVRALSGLARKQLERGDCPAAIATIDRLKALPSTGQGTDDELWRMLRSRCQVVFR